MSGAVPPFGPPFLGRYEIVRRLGEGAMGAVFLARDRALERLVAVKSVLGLEPTSRARFVREGRALASLAHPSILRIFDAGGGEGEHAYLVFEYVEGESLRETIEREAPLAIPTAVRIADQVLAGLEHAHAQGIVHRDVKPENVLMPAAGGLKVADFGLARPPTRDLTRSLTETGTILGTPAYMAPEQIRAEKATVASDLYAAGVLLFEMVTGRLPFEAPTLVELLQMQLRMAPPDPRTLRPDLSPVVAAAIERALAKAPHERFRSATDFRALLRTALQTTAELTEERPVPPAPDRSRDRTVESDRSRPRGAPAVAATVVRTAPTRSREPGLARAKVEPAARPVQRGLAVAAGGAALLLAAALIPLGGRSPPPPRPATAAGDPTSAALPPMRPTADPLADIAGAIDQLAPRSLIERMWGELEAIPPRVRADEESARQAPQLAPMRDRMAMLRLRWARELAYRIERARLQRLLDEISRQGAGPPRSGPDRRAHSGAMLALQDLVDLWVYCQHFRIPFPLSSPLLDARLGQRTTPSLAGSPGTAVLFEPDAGEPDATAFGPPIQVVRAEERARFHTHADMSVDLLATLEPGYRDHLESRPLALALPAPEALASAELFARVRELPFHSRFLVFAGTSASDGGVPIAVLRWKDLSRVMLHHDVTGLLPPTRTVFLKVRLLVLPGVSGDEATYLEAIGLRYRLEAETTRRP